MKLTAQVKLVVTKTQAKALKETLARANASCDSISEWAWANQTFGQYAIHKGQYVAQRASSGLTAQVVVRAIAKVADAYKLDKHTQRTFQPTGAIAYDDRILRWYVDKGEVSIWSVDGRLKLPFVCGDYQRGLLAFQQGESDLAFVNGNFYLLTTVNIPDAPLVETDGVLGVDLGIVQLATDSEGRSYSGEAVKACRRRAKRIRALLQSKGTKNAKKHLKRMRQRTANYQRWVNHNISKQLVQNAHSSRKALALEDLSGIRQRASAFNREMKWQMGNWAFAQLGTFVSYKAKQAGIAVHFVDPRNTSRTCSACGYCDKANRKSQSQFLCLSCGRVATADYHKRVTFGYNMIERFLAMPKVTLTCQSCGSEYQRWPSKAQRGSSFCSPECRKTGLTRSEYRQKYSTDNRVHLRDKARERMQDPILRQAHREHNRRQSRKVKEEAIAAYGGCFCSCNHNGTPCGEHPIEFLAIDHINGEGKTDENGGYRLYARLKKLGYPSGFRVLCHNCNLSLGFFGYCPHSDTETQTLWHHNPENAALNIAARATVRTPIDAPAIG